MAAGTLPAPGTEYGPCEPKNSGRGMQLTCGHVDCEATRRQAAAACRLCGAPIGYDRRYFVDDHEPVHASCLEATL